MGLRSALGLASKAEAGLLVPFDQFSHQVGILSPRSPDVLKGLILSEVFDLGDYLPMTREEALSIPGVYRARAILLSLIADKPLDAWRGDALALEQPLWFQRTPGILGPWNRMAATLDDLIFYPWSLWLTTRGAVSGGRAPILDAVHCPYESWQVNTDGEIEISDGEGGWRVASEDEVILIPGPSEGLLAYANRTLRGSRDLESAWVSRAKTPSPLTELHITDDTQLDDEEMMGVRDAWAAARKLDNGAVAMTPSNIEVIDHGTADAALFIEGRNSSRMDIAAFFNLPAAILDATTAQASLTYVTQEGTRTSVYDLSLPYWVRPIEARLSQDDVLPAGQSARFDFSTLAPNQPAPVTED